MSKTKEQILNEEKTLKEIEQIPIRFAMDKLVSIQQLICTHIPVEGGFGENQNYLCIWNEEELEILKHKILTIVRDM